MKHKPVDCAICFQWVPSGISSWPQTLLFYQWPERSHNHWTLQIRQLQQEQWVTRSGHRNKTQISWQVAINKHHVLNKAKGKKILLLQKKGPQSRSPDGRVDNQKWRSQSGVGIVGGEWSKEHLPGRYCKLWGPGRNSCTRRALPSLQPSSCPWPEPEHRCHTVPGPALGCSQPSRDGGWHPVPTAKELEGGNHCLPCKPLAFFFFFLSLY